MPTSVGKNINLCFIKVKFPLTSSSLLTASDNGLPLPSSAATPSSLLFSPSNSLSTHSSSHPNPELESHSEPDIATIFASQRFFFTSPGSSNSIIESTPTSTAANQTSNKGHHHTRSTVKDGVAVPTLSPNPYMDFRQSMQEMVEARGLMDVKANWDNLHELLLCYLALNPKSTHKYIVGAFADLVVSLIANASTPQRRRH
ncbi:hypothetical protein ERO13_D08G074400v2 [Gossypium hirsutum]|uniref:Transcription repressor n=1 Tax=Gossypium hirsutum TaxID=3635 RepID=A0A1U8K9P9_GOSHI|nr:transcription repressor OFP12-like [Gossypium hirsutum]KAG4133101.1 hypothetical protein ERO13_D08G074400v2 [Gossypium hirsutum]